MCVINKTGDNNIDVFNLIIGINEAKILAKHISFYCKCKFGGEKCISNQK